ncbi:hypothetical protein QR685DRAFT_513931 [Neurospora intermedia]|uniref:Uncharacterized protein n=1 Tax=Neurospora intermedia TaxID=5142 RepID=A0ABR3DT94_NEUIN
MTTLATNCTCTLANECPLASECTISATTGFDLKLLIIIPGIIVWPLDMGYYVITHLETRLVSALPDKPLLLSTTRTAPAEQGPPPPYYSAISVA